VGRNLGVSDLQITREVSIAFSRPVPVEAREASIDALRARGVEPSIRHLAFAGIEDDPVTLVLTIVIGWAGKTAVEEAVKPTAKVVGEAMRDALGDAAAALRGRLGLDGTYIVEVEAGERHVKYWVPANEHEDEAWDTMQLDFEARPTTNGDRRWWVGKGWMTDPEIWREARTKPHDE
jgi:hypothetical protein